MDQAHNVVFCPHIKLFYETVGTIKDPGLRKVLLNPLNVIITLRKLTLIHYFL